MNSTTYQTASAEETAALAAELASQLVGKNIFLYGDLGAGKTTFTRAFAVALGVVGLVTSPTFVYEKSYDIPPDEVLSHWDLYRLDQVDVELAARLGELCATPATVVVEWPERLADSQFPRERVEIRLSETNELDVREIAISYIHA